MPPIRAVVIEWLRVGNPEFERSKVFFVLLESPGYDAGLVANSVLQGCLHKFKPFIKQRKKPQRELDETSFLPIIFPFSFCPLCLSHVRFLCLGFGLSALGGNEHKSPATDGHELAVGQTATR